MKKSKKLYLLLIFLYNNISCKPTNSEDRQESETQAIVSESDYYKGIRTLAASPLFMRSVPFGFAKDGCYARALLMSAKLALVDIPSTSFYARTGEDSPPLELDKNGEVIRWSYHVAPLLVVIKNQQVAPMIIDPSIAANYALNVREWLAAFKADKPYVNLYARPGSCYFGEDPQRGCYRVDFQNQVLESQLSQALIDSIHKMPKFMTSELSQACKVLKDYGEVLKNQNRPTLGLTDIENVTRTMVNGLRNKGLLYEDALFDCFRSDY